MIQISPEEFQQKLREPGVFIFVQQRNFFWIRMNTVWRSFFLISNNTLNRFFLCRQPSVKILPVKELLRTITWMTIAVKDEIKLAHFFY